ncbi:hypothetical protein H8N03_05265 [Ramlibacter sp. USB13]|uniref:Uncharacterized protein n=1 Tax=Ramlibacter cellulosilyticus TaxID=2764187 RepID=A0A923MQI5_9BURK|nr:hypothetical protein [Ramlibacter cellulosilyticus]MBC5782344.1 hypothetical protein [Ramlibacter cellulosilyticus]
MAAALAASLLNFVLGSAGGDAANRVTFEGLSSRFTDDGALGIAIRKVEAASLRIASGPLVVEVGQLALHQVALLVRVEGGRPRIERVEAASAELSGVKVDGPLPDAAARAAVQADPCAWTLAPLAAAEGTLRAEIVDAHLLFDANVKVPIRHGGVDFNEASVEHVGPDSRMGVSRMGVYVDAPNGRSYLYQFPSTPVAGVEYERRGALLGPWAVTQRGKLQLQPFLEGLLRQGRGHGTAGLTDPARQLFDRTSVSGHVQLGDGHLTLPGVEAEMGGSSEGRNTVRLHSKAVGRELTVEIAGLSVRNVVARVGALKGRCREVAGDVTLRVFVEGTQLRLAVTVPALKLSALHLG